jgi:hypothetical protein
MFRSWVWRTPDGSSGFACARPGLMIRPVRHVFLPASWMCASRVDSGTAVHIPTGQTGLGTYLGWLWSSWYRWTTLVAIAHVIVVVTNCWTGEDPFLGEGAVEAFELAVGLRPVRTRVFGADAQLDADITPAFAAVAGAVVGQHSHRSYPACGEPSDRVTQHAGRGGRGLVVVNLRVGDPAVIVEHDVHEPMAEFGVVVGVACGARRGGPIAFALDPAGKPPIAIQVAGLTTLSWIPTPRRAACSATTSPPPSARLAMPTRGVPIASAPSGSTFAMGMFAPNGGLAITGGTVRSARLP